MEAALDFLSSVLDEVSLEGLDGITLSTLWMRLQNRPHFPLSLDDDSKIFLWECIAVHKEIEIYELPAPRPSLMIFNRYDYIDTDLGVVVEPANIPKDIYSVEPVFDGEYKGSCSTYKIRKCITSDIRYDNVLLLSLNQAVEKWGDTLVLVSSPKCRLLSLIGTETNPLIELSIEEYCLLERIGRSRYMGEVSHGESGLLSLKAPYCKQLHYYRTKLSRKGLITKQLHYLKSKKGHTGSGRLFHLTRFYIQRKSKLESLMKCLCDILQDKPKNREESKILRQELGVKENTFKRLFQRPFQRCIKLMNVAHREMYPEATAKACLLTNGQERFIKVVHMLKHCDEDDEEEDVTQEKETTLPSNEYFDYSKIYHDLPLIAQAYRLIKAAGPEGMSGQDLGRAMTLPRLDTRSLLRLLSRKGKVISMLQDRGRQKVTKYILKEFQTESQAYTRVKEQKEKLIKDTPSTEKKILKRPLEDEGTSPKAKKVKFNDVVHTVIYERDEKQNSNHQTKKSSKSNFQDIVSEIIEMQNAGILIGKSPKVQSVSEQPTEKGYSSSQVTFRFLKRANMILEYLKTVQLSTISELQKFLIEKEKEEGYNWKIDKKSTVRIVNKLSNEKRLKLYKAVLRLENESKELQFICADSVETADARIQAAMEQAKFKYFSVCKDKGKNAKNQKKLNSLEESATKNESKEEKTQQKPPLLFQPSFGRIFYGLQPKFVRTKTLHLFLYYLSRKYEGTLENISEEPIVYHSSMTWKRFVPPLPDYNKEGWCFLADVISRMPLSIFLKVINLRYEIPGIEQYVGNEEKEHYLIKHLPQDLRNHLLLDRKYLFMMNDVIKRLCYIGLVSFGPQVQKLKDQVYVYVHKKTKLRDTTISTPGYIYVDSDLLYETKHYDFNSLSDVENYWIDLETICLHTPLGKYGLITGKTITVAEASHKPDMIEALKAKDFSDICNDENIPGDGLGAAGFDSALFSHLKRNWCWASIPWRHADKVQANLQKMPLSSHSMQYLLQTRQVSGPEKRGRLQRLTKNTLLHEVKKGRTKQQVGSKNELEDFGSTLKSKKRKRGYRTLARKDVKKTRRPYYDDKDKAAMKKMSKHRCDWTAQEDSFLLLCKVASSFLNPTSRRLVVPFTLIRDLLHEHLPEISDNKSSRACQRRVRYMMLNPTTSSNVAVFLGESKQDQVLVAEFSNLKPPITKEEKWKVLFTCLLNKLLKKFTMSASDRCKNITLPETLSQFSELYEIMSSHNVFDKESSHKEPENVEDVYRSTIYSLVVSSMAIMNEGSKWSYTLHKLYERYPENFLRSVVAQLRNDKVIAAKKSSTKKDLQHTHSSSIPYRFSVTYENALLTKFPRRMYGDCKELLNKLVASETSSKIELKGNIPSGYTAAIVSLATTNQLVISTKVPDQIILFDSSLSKEVRCTIVERMTQTLSDKESNELSRLLNNENSQLFPENNLETPLESCEMSESPTDDLPCVAQSDAKSCRPNSEMPCSSNASRFALYMLRQEFSQPPIERVQHSQDYIVLNSCRVSCEFKENPISRLFTVTPQKVFKKDSSGKTDLDSDAITKGRQILTSEDISDIMSSLTLYIPSGALAKDQNYMESLEVIYEQYSLQTLNDAKGIYDHIFKLGKLGVSEKVLWQKFEQLSGELSVFEHLHLFKEAIFVVRVGVSYFRYVATMHSHNWIINSFLLQSQQDEVNKDVNATKVTDIESIDSNSCSNNLNDDSVTSHEVNDIQTSKQCENSVDQEQTCSALQENKSCSVTSNCETKSDIANEVDLTTHTEKEETTTTSKHEKFRSEIGPFQDVHFVSRTWRKPDGSLNAPAFFELLQTVLSYIISSPGVTEERVCDRFSLVLQPVQILELIEVLEKAHCIYKYFCKPMLRGSLFSRPADLYVVTNPKPEDMIHLESLPDAVFKISKLQGAMT